MKKVNIGNVSIGCGCDIAIQSMLNVPTTDIAAVKSQITALSNAGCDIIRLAVPTNEAADAMGEIVKFSPVPIVADIHFDYRLALRCIEQGVHKIRINPGNLGGEDRAAAVAKAAKAAGIPIRIGVNGGSLEKDLTPPSRRSRATSSAYLTGSASPYRGGFNADRAVLSPPPPSVVPLPLNSQGEAWGRRGDPTVMTPQSPDGDSPPHRGAYSADRAGGLSLQGRLDLARAMVESARRHVEILNRYDFDDIVLSMKSSDVRTTISAYRLAAAEFDYPLHLGVTEAGTTKEGIVKSAVGIGALLADSIGSTIRVSLTDDPVREVEAAQLILKSLDLYGDCVSVVSCPTCGRTKIDLIPIANAVTEAVSGIRKKLKVAVMGCVVNGPGEASDADIGIAGGDGCAVLFKKGEIVGKIPENEIVERLLREIETM